MKPRLKALELHGYKTFASRVMFEFPGNITAIVGPNGSGKSNISDALRWVLGEQSYTLLRGKRTDDMIFAGSDQRPRAGMASASITFDNEEGWLPIDYSEVLVARRATRDGDNEYLLNKQRVRLRDVSELLAQSGLAERTYTIIGQGLVDAALSLRPEERRKFFEEAAGIGLFRSRREESLTRLDSTRRNLERVQDILSELEPRLRSLERQAKRAEEYDHVQADLQVLLRDWYGYHWQNTQKDLVRSKEILRNHEEKVKSARQKRLDIDTNVQTARTRLMQLREELNLWHTESAGIHSGREKISRDLAVLDERFRSLRDQEVSLRNDLNNNEEQSVVQKEKLESLIEEKTRLQGDLIEAQEQLKIAQTQLDVRQKEREKIEDQLRQARRLLSESESKQVQLKAHQRELTSRMESQSNTQLTLTNNIKNSASAFAEVSKQKEDAQKNLEVAQLTYEELQLTSAKHIDELHKKEEEEKHYFQELNRLESEHSRLKAQLDVLDQAENALTGLAEGAKNLIQAAKAGKLKGQFKAISSLLEVPDELETAIGSVLGDQLDAILMDAATDPDEALDYLDLDTNGRAILVPTAWARSIEKIKEIKDQDVLGVAADLVGGSKELKPMLTVLLGQVLVVKNRVAAKRLLESIPQSGRIVTLKGEVFLGSGVIIAGKDKRASLVGRPRQRRELMDRIENVEGALDEHESKFGILKEAIQNLRATRQKEDQGLRTSRQEVEACERTYQAAARGFDQQNQKNEWQQSQLVAINDDIKKTTIELADIDKQIGSGTEKISEQTEVIREVNQQLRGVSLEEFQTQVVHWNTSVAVVSRGVADAERRQAEYSQTVKQNQSSVENINLRLGVTASQLADSEKQKVILQKQELELNEAIAKLQVKIDPAEKELAEVETHYSKLQDDYTFAQQAETNAERSSTQSQLEVARIIESLENLRRKIEEDFGLVQLEYNADVTGPTPLPLEGVNQLNNLSEIPQGLEDSINRQRALMRRMGAINPDAKLEYNEVKERFDYLTNQMADLRKADEDLRQIISELDDLMRTEFRKTFNAVAAEFKLMFTRLFGGGSARLILTDDENPTETGIDIEAKLPGRREQGLSLLSGGERSLTAVALIFSLLKVSPTPFCVMDEVDAALDEANVGRFTELLKELSQDIQFILITHNRNTVQVADVIYGVTMGRDSASQVISLRLDEISEDMVK
ncbi:MAG: chromosome segregation protein SMC [Anaerolineae bacterium]|nr:chromosome segregation protein SMC [Anaerolineae bacterium]